MLSHIKVRHLLIYMILFGCFSLHSLEAQKVLQLEKAGTLKTVKIPVGTTITFKLKNDDTGWYERTIYDIDPESGYLDMEGVQIHVDSISMLKFDKKPFVPNLLGTAMQAGGANMILFDVSRGLTWDKERGIDNATVIAGATNIAVGTLLKKIFNSKKFRVGKRKRLRLLDLSFGDPVIPRT